MNTRTRSRRDDKSGKAAADTTGIDIREESNSESDDDDDLIPYGYCEVFKQFKSGALIRVGFRPLRPGEDDFIRTVPRMRRPKEPRYETNQEGEGAKEVSSTSAASSSSTISASGASTSRSTGAEAARKKVDTSPLIRKIPVGRRGRASQASDVDLSDIHEYLREAPEEAEDENSDSSDDNAIPVENKLETVRVRWRGQAHTFDLHEMDTVLKLKELLSNVAGNITPEEMRVYKEEGLFPLEEWLTIQELNVEPETILEASRNLLEDIDDSANGRRKEDLRPADPSLVTLRIQNSNLRNRNTMVYMNKAEPMTRLRELYINKAGLSGQKLARQIKFMYDGERVNLSQTPDDLGFEDGECLDVLIK